MNDYGEIIRLPYKEDDIYKIVKDLLKYDRLKNIVLKNQDEENKIFNLVTRKNNALRGNINVEIATFGKDFTEIKVYSRSVFLSPFDFGSNRRNVKMIVDAILGELESSEMSKEVDDIYVEVIKIANPLKDILNFIVAGIIIYYLGANLCLLYKILTEGFYNLDMMEEFKHFAITGIVLSFFYIFYKCVRRRRYKVTREYKIKQELFNLMKKKKPIENGNDFTKTKVNNIFGETKSYLNKAVDYAKKVKTGKPKGFLPVAIIGSVFLVWALWSIFSGGISKIGKDPCDINYEATGLSIDHVDWCRTDWHGNATEKLPYGLDNNDFIWCSFWNDGNWIGDGPVYIECAKELGWDGTNGE